MRGRPASRPLAGLLWLWLLWRAVTTYTHPYLPHRRTTQATSDKAVLRCRGVGVLRSWVVVVGRSEGGRGSGGIVLAGSTNPPVAPVGNP
eukprot:scaffold7381_cov132-Isochrysis_galbana.AAC.6